MPGPELSGLRPAVAVPDERTRHEALLRNILMNLQGDATRLTREQLVYKLEMVRALVRAGLRLPPGETPDAGA